MKIVAATTLRDSLIADFVRRFPKVMTRAGSYGKCKFLSYELALYLRRRGVRATVLHCQSLAKNHGWKKTAHASWVEKPRSEWSHYVVVSDGLVYDVTARQFDQDLPVPFVIDRAVLSTYWDTVERDTFVNNMVTEVLRSHLDAGRTLRPGAVSKIAPAAGAQQLRPPVANP